ncbi:MAG TPA: hypothetical protein VN289_05715 [Paraburkholderia sp.]|nr:hypothetical protein [Paraburkholderia sp.]
MFRWHRYRNPVTAAQVAEARSKSSFSMMQCKALLEEATPWVLQYFDENAMRWVDVPSVEEPHSRT